MEQQAVEQRKAPRFPVDLEALCRAGGHSWTTQLRNISATGCMILSPGAELPEGIPLRLRLKGLPAIEARIVWHNRGHLGLRFAELLEPGLLGELGLERPEADVPAPTHPVMARPLSGLHAGLVRRARPGDPDERIAASG